LGCDQKEIDNCEIPNSTSTAAKKPIGAGKPLIAQALGHGTTTVTDTYFDYDNELVDDLNRKVLDLLNSEEPENQDIIN